MMRFKTTEGEEIIACNSMKILGIIKNNRDSIDSHLNMVGGRISGILAELKPLLKYMNLKTRKEIIYSKAASILLYGSELYSGMSEWSKNRFSVILMKCNKAIFRKDYFKVSNKKICKEIGVEMPDQMCRKATLKKFHKIIWNQSPPQIFNLIRFNTRHRDCSKLSLTYPISTQVSRQTAIESALTLYNSIPQGLKMMNPRRLKKALSKIKI